MQSSYPIYIVRQGDTLWKVARDIYQARTNSDISWRVQSLRNLNRHIGSGDFIYPGQVLYVGTEYMGGSLDALAQDLKSSGEELAYLSQDERDFLAENFEVLTVFDQEIQNPYQSALLNELSITPNTLASGFGEGFSALSGAFTKIGEGTMKKMLDPLHWVKQGISTYSHGSKGKFGALFSVPTHSIQYLQGELVRGVGKRVRYIRESNDIIRMIPQNARAFQQGGKITVIQPGTSGYLALTRTVARHKEIAKMLKMGIKPIALGLDLKVAYDRTMADQDTNRQYITPVAEAVKIGTKLGLGAKVGLSSATLVCGALTVTTGVGGVACYFTVFVVAGAAFSSTVDFFVDGAADLTTDLIYSGQENVCTY